MWGFNGSSGSVRQIVKHESLPIIACVGLDRMLRTYDINTRKQKHVVYLKQRLKCMLFCNDNLLSSEEDDDGIEGINNAGEATELGEEITGNIDDADEVIDYVDSSADEMTENDIEEVDDSEDHDEEDDLSDPNKETFDGEAKGSPKTKRRRQI